MDSVIVRLLESVARPVALALVHSLWQGALIAGLVAATLALLRRGSAALRYGVACAGLLAILTAGVATAVWFVRHPEPTPSARVIWRQAVTATEAGADETPVDAGEARAVSAETGASGGPQAGRGEEVATSDRGLLGLPAVDMDLAGPWVFSGWVAGVLALAGLHLNGWRHTRELARAGTEAVPREWRGRLARLARLAGLARAVRVVTSRRVTVPTVVGWLRPVILVPVASFTDLRASDLELVLIHELAHIRRHDVLVNYIQVTAETLLFYHPAVWWMSRRIRIEREHCCDDCAVRATGDSVAYARALSEVEHMRETIPAHAMAADGGVFRRRIGRLVGAPHSGGSPRRAGLAGVLVITLVLGVSVPSLTAAPGGAASAKAPDVVPSQWNDVEGEWRAGGFGGSIRMHFDVSDWGECSLTLDDDGFEESDGVYRLERDAGTFILEGGRIPRKWRKATFRPDAAYAAAMQDLGYEIKKGERLLELAIHDVSLDFARGIAKAGFDISVSRLVEFHIHDVTPEYVRAMADAGYDQLTPDRIVEFAIHDIDPEYVTRMAAVGYEDLNPGRIIEFAIHDVEPEYVERMAAVGYEELTPARIIEFAIHDIDAEYVERMAAIGYDQMTPSRIIEFGIHGIEAEYVEQLAAAWPEELPPSRIVEFAIHGIEPEFVSGLAELGYGPADMSPGRVVEFAIHDVSPEFIRDLREQGITDLTPSELVERRLTGGHRGGHGRHGGSL